MSNRDVLGQFFLDSRIFSTRSFFNQNFFWPKFFSWPKIFLTQNFFDPKFFWPKKIFDTIFLTQNFFLTQIFFWANQFLTQNLFWTNFFFSKRFWPPNFFDPKFFDTKFSFYSDLVYQTIFMLRQEASRGHSVCWLVGWSVGLSVFKINRAKVLMKINK